MLPCTEEFPVKKHQKPISGYKKNKIAAYSCRWVGGDVFTDGTDLVPAAACLFAELPLAPRVRGENSNWFGGGKKKKKRKKR